MFKRYVDGDLKIQISIYQSDSGMLTGVLEVKRCGKVLIGTVLKRGLCRAYP